MSTPITRLNPETMPDSTQSGYSQISIVEPGRMAYVSGQVATMPDGAPVPDDLVAQMRIVARHARSALDALGARPQDIVIARCFVTDLTAERLNMLMPPLIDAFEGAAPSLTGIGVTALAGAGLQVELELTVRLPD
ncbi:RidA family protein [Roseinatronobacter sp. S2]|uniref:RidA family protein n=1 Tax=Roseinatronobacter sp. S2 TaxID=3035471 RepID=UPI0024104F1A|nr:RidA family protein [Roseinatronobacter sp. S2]WFE76538.1 RidA family protein [Roseinatronobacter sp. S2]